MDATTASSPKRDNTTPSCTVCQRRKVKCNRIYPCAPCTKTGLECSFKSVNRHRQKRATCSNLNRVLDGGHKESRRHSHVFSSARSTASKRERNDEPPSPVSPGSPNTARLVSDGSGYRYVNNHLWNSLPVQIKKISADSPAVTIGDVSTPSTHPIVTNSGSSGSETFENVVHQSYELAGASESSTASCRSFLFDQVPTTRPIARVSPRQVVQLWQAYLSNVDPMMKVFHAPSVQQLVLGQIGRPTMAENEQALVYAIHFISIVSLNDSECRMGLGETRDDLLRRFRQATEEGLSNASFVTTTDLTVLQALILYLAALRSLGDTQTVWSLTGLAIRVAATIGLARDGDLLALSPFEAEIRRRIWWAIVYLDARTSELVGQDGDLLVSKYDVKPPSNLNDSELNPSMSRLPEFRTCSGEVVYVQLRATLALCLRRIPKLQGAGGIWKRLEGKTMPILEKIEVVERLEQQFKDEILDYCDPAVPLQRLTMNSASTFLNKMKLVAHDDHSSSLGEYSEDTFQLSMHVTQLQIELFSEPCLQRWRWHWEGQFQWYALACLIRQTRLRPPGSVTRKAWAIIRTVFDIVVPSLALGPRKSPILDAIKTLLDTSTGSKEQPKPTMCTLTSNHIPISSNPVAISNMLTPAPTSPERTRALIFGRTGYGSQPHSALLPGMFSATTTGTVTGPDMQSSINGTVFEDATLGTELGAIDWAEFDRLTKELCAQ